MIVTTPILILGALWMATADLFIYFKVYISFFFFFFVHLEMIWKDIENYETHVAFLMSKIAFNNLKKKKSTNNWNFPSPTSYQWITFQKHNTLFSWNIISQSFPSIFWLSSLLPNSLHWLETSFFCFLLEIIFDKWIPEK